MYNRGSCSNTHWPNTWQDAMKVLRETGYKDPMTYYICLSGSHYCSWDVMKTESDMCKICGAKGTIPYYYLSIKDKVQTWCADAEFCAKNPHSGENCFLDDSWHLSRLARVSQKLHCGEKCFLDLCWHL